MRMITFNDKGEPLTDGIDDGSVLVLFTQKTAEVVKLDLLPQEIGGPCLTPALNWDKLEHLVMELIREHHPDCIGSDEHYTFECPEGIACQANF